MKKYISLFLTLLLALGLVGFAHAQDDDELSGELEIFSWWAGDEAPALEALIALYNEMHPNVEVINATVTGGSGVNARAVLKTRMLGGNPPDSFQVHAGEELTGTWVVADRMEDLTFMFEENGWFDVLPEDLLDTITYEGGVFSVPVNIHRSNVLWYLPETLDELGLEVPATIEEFLAVCPDIQAAGLTPLVVAEPWTVNHLWETIALGVLGAEGWNGIWTGETGVAGLTDVYATFLDVLECTNIDADAAGLSWQQATDRVIEGEAVFNIMGDWAAGYLTTTLGLEPGEDFGFAASFGTDGIFMWLSDSFGLPLGITNRENTLAWLELMLSIEGQNAFNTLKGSIPARVDAVEAAMDEYNAYLLSAADDWAVDVLVGSLAHGTAANERFMGDFGQTIEILLSTGNPQAAANAFAAICSQAAACGQ
ncbi:MAG: carbohydrate ABC transporter substrate-binding protein [Anaerolineaceae bacterium]|nr:MAG: carbohydrate ABC transporter substrate-binding protein [Anaerolineaceae bacterium]